MESFTDMQAAISEVSIFKIPCKHKHNLEIYLHSFDSTT